MKIAKIEKEYLKKIKLFQEYNKYYYDKSDPQVTDSEFDSLKEEIIELENSIKNKKNTTHEAADVIYHLLVTLESAGINFDDIIKELQKREGTSGFEEKRNR